MVVEPTGLLLQQISMLQAGKIEFANWCSVVRAWSSMIITQDEH
jgi:hypothetical protein